MSPGDLLPDINDYPVLNEATSQEMLQVGSQFVENLLAPLKAHFDSFQHLSHTKWGCLTGSTTTMEVSDEEEACLKHALLSYYIIDVEMLVGGL